MKVSSATLRRRISRSLVTVLALSIIPVVVAPVLTPQIAAPQANAADANLIQTNLTFDANATAGANDVASNMTFGSVAPTHTNSGVGYYTFDGTLNKFAYVNRDFTNAAAVSIFMWVYPTATGMILNHSGQIDPYDGFRLSTFDYTASGKFRLGLYSSGGAVFLTSTQTTPINNWYYIGVTYDGSIMRGYINGQLIGTSSAFSWLTAASDYFHVGSSQNGTCFGTCPTVAGSFLFGQLSIYRSTLSGANVLTNYNATQNRFAPIITNPASVTTDVNQNITLSSGTCTTSSTAPCTYQWQRSTDSGSNWSDIAGATSSTLAFNQISRSVSGYQYRVIATDSGNSSPNTTALLRTSAAATITVNAEPSGETDTARTFNGTSQYAWVADTGTGGVFDITGAITLQAWVNPTESLANTQYTVICKSEAYQLFHYGGFWKYSLQGSTGWGSGVPTGIKVALNEWHHIAITRAANTNAVNFYYDGQLVFSGNANTAGSSTIASNNLAFGVGGMVYNNPLPSVQYGFKGQIDQVAIFDVVRSLSDIDNDMDSYISPTTAGLRAYYDFNETSGSTLIDRSSRATTNSDLALIASPGLNDVKSVSSTSAHTTVKFPRTYITSSGGWVVPSGVSQVSAFIVGGGGGGGWNSGGGGSGGGYLIQNSIAVSGTVGVQIGSGGRAGQGPDVSSSPTYLPGDGFPTVFNGTSVAGGIKGSIFPAVTGGASISTASGTSGIGGNGGATSGTPGGAGGAGFTQSNFGDTLIYSAGGGGGGYGAAGGVGGGSASSGAGNGGGTVTTTGTSGLANRGGGGGASSQRVDAGNGGSGVVIVKYLVASSKPVFSGPFNDTTTAGLVETFTVTGTPNSPLVRSYQWQVSTDTGTSWSTPTQGSGINSASYVTPVLTTSVSGNRYQYRVIVTDSDTAGLRMTETSSAVFLIINPALTLTGNTTIQKAINVAKVETFTVTGGTATHRYTLTPTISGITLDTSTALAPVIRISETKTVGTYYETLTVTDSVSATTFIAVTIIVIAPPSFSASSEQVVSGTVLDLDPGSSASYSGSGTAWNDLAGRAANANLAHPFGTTASYADGSTRSGTYSNITCGGANFNSENFGGFEFTTVGQCIYATNSIPVNVASPVPVYTVSTWIKRNGPQSAWKSVICNPYRNASDQIIYCLFWTGTNTLNAGVFNGSAWQQTTSVVVPDLTWVYVTVTYNGSNLLSLYINDTATSYFNNLVSATWASNKINTGLIIGRKWDNLDTFIGSVGQIRVYDRILTSTEIVQNYNATKGRYLTTLNKRIQSKKYGVLLSDTYTVTSGADAISTTFLPNNRSAIKWDTSTARSTRLSLLETLTVGTYNETITATDSLGQSVYLSLSFTVTKADTITVTAGAATTQVYNKAPATLLPDFAITGLVASDTGTVVRKYTGVDWTKTCAEGGGCEVGDVGPGGGTIFYISPTVIDSATGISSGGTYLEVAPMNWWGTNSETTTAWSTVSTTVTGTSSALGSGAENTRLINTALGATSVAAKLAADLTFNGKSDWFLPSTLEVKEIYDALYLPGLGGNFSVRNYWTSTQGSNIAQADTYWFGNGGLISTTDKLNPFTVRPIRAYSPDTITTTTVPTNVDSYTVTVDTITMTTGSLSNYESVVFQRSGLDITKARQDSLRPTAYVGNFGTPFTLTILGGLGTGAVTESLAAGSTATGCSLTNHVISSSTVGSCAVQLKKAYSRNYFTETVTAVVYLMQWVINQPSTATGGGSTMAINGETAITRDPNAAPNITNVSTSGDMTYPIAITGSGFTAANAGTTTIKFWRNQILGAGDFIIKSDTLIWAKQPVTATVGKVLLINSNGTAASPAIFTPLVFTP